jgi:hypothetical protein
LNIPAFVIVVKLTALRLHWPLLSRKSVCGMIKAGKEDLYEEDLRPFNWTIHHQYNKL